MSISTTLRLLAFDFDSFRQIYRLTKRRINDWLKSATKERKPTHFLSFEMNRESGSYKGKRRTRGARHKIRTVMFMAMMSAIQCNPVFKRYYQRLKAAGKMPKIALIACMRKLIVILNTMLKSEELW